MLSVVVRLKTLWSGGLPLRQAFWDYAVFWGVLINLAASALSLGLLLTTRHLSSAAIAPTTVTLLAFVMHSAPLPYNVLTLVGVWRSANNPAVPLAASIAARAATVALFAAFLLI